MYKRMMVLIAKPVYLMNGVREVNLLLNSKLFRYISARHSKNLIFWSLVMFKLFNVFDLQRFYPIINYLNIYLINYLII